MAHLRPGCPAHARSGGFQAPAAVSHALELQYRPRSGVPAFGCLRTPVRRTAARPVLCAPSSNREGRLGAALQPLLGGVSDDRLQGRLPRVDAATPLQSLPAKPAWSVGRHGRTHGEDRLALSRRPVRDHAARDRENGLRRLLGPQALCDQHLHRQAALDFHRGPRSQQLARLQRREDLFRHGRRQRLRVERPDGTPRLAGEGADSVRPSRVFLRDADNRLRTHLHRQHRRDALRLRSSDRPTHLGATSRHVHLYGGSRVEAAGIRRDL